MTPKFRPSGGFCKSLGGLLSLVVRRAISRPPASTKYTHPPSPRLHHPSTRRQPFRPTCAAEKTKSAELIDDAAINLLAAKLRTPLQIEQHLSLAFEEAFRVGEKPVTVEVIEAILSRQIDDLEPKLMRHGYDVRIL